MNRIGRNDPCPCGSGKKYKNCCLMKDRAIRIRESAWRRDEQLVLNKLIDFAQRPDFSHQLFVAFNLFWNGNYGVDGLDALDRHEVSRFLDWYMYDYRLEEKRKRIIELFLEEQAPELSSDERECARIWQDSHLSLYRITGLVGEETISVVDVLQEKSEHILADGVSVHGLRGDLVLGRLLRSSTTPHFSWAAILLPATMEGELSSFIKESYEQYRQTVLQATWPEFLSNHGYLLNHYLLRSAAAAGERQYASRMYYDAHGTLERLRAVERKLQEKLVMATERRWSEEHPSEETSEPLRQTSGGILLPGYVQYKGSKEIR
ncbi:MAG: SEC-C metal-binding domain-containing protein [Anaerolineae bacterium]